MLLQHKNPLKTKTQCIIAFGSNLFEQKSASAKIINDALLALSRNELSQVEISKFYLTPAFPANSGPDFINGVLTAQTDLSSSELLAILHKIEADLGRVRSKRWGTRAIDLDLIDHGGEITPSMSVYKRWRDLPLERQLTDTPPEMILPHPRVQDRPFVLVPLLDVLPDWKHPVSKESLNDLLAKFEPAALDEIKPYIP